jgi:hypothetical protein
MRIRHSTVATVTALILALVSGLLTCAQGAQIAGDAQAAQRKLFLRGAELWPVYCNTCHNARPGSEFSPSEWNMIMMHMRTQGNLPAQDAQAILEFLKSSR